MDIKDKQKEVIIVPHTHWDREWYKPFQYFRANLVKLIDKLIEINRKQDYYFMLDGQTIVLEDYFEIRKENKEELLDLIKKGKIEVGPWYVLPDEWLVGQESLIRNLEVSYNLSKKYNIPLMKLAYLPDQFGHTRAIPQLVSDLTDFSGSIIWRGVGEEINTVPFIWKGNENSTKSILGIYMPYGYGNAAHLTDENKEELKSQIETCVKDLESFSPFPLYLLMNGTDHQFPKEKIPRMLKEIKYENLEVKLGSLSEFIEKLNEKMKKENYGPAHYAGEFRSSERAPLLQDTYSSRVWIKQWNQKIEDLLVHYAEPLSTYLSYYYTFEYPKTYLDLAWKWLLKNHPHDSICGCSIDQTHEEMKSRFYWSESIANIILENILAKMSLDESEKPKEIMIFNPTNSSEPTYFEFDFPLDFPIKTIISEDGQRYTIQPLYSSQEKILDEKMKPLMLKSGLKLLPGRKIIDDYINEVIINKDEENSICEIKIICGKKPIGELNIDKMKKELKEMINSGKFKLFHVVATRGVKQKYASFAPLKPWSFTRFTVNSSIKANDNTITQKEFNVTKNTISNNYYIVKFKRNGSFSLYDKKTKTEYSLLHQFEDTGDRGDEYTYSFVGPVKTKLSKTKRRIITKGEVFTVVEEKATFKTFRQLDEKREKRIGKTKIDVVTHFTFFRDSPRIDIKTKIFNTAKDHRLRITFSLPFSSKKTYTSTHFGYIERNSYPKEAENYVEKPSGIQAQKRWIRVGNEKGEEAFTLINKGLPEVELVEGSKLCLTLLRSVGWLSRSDFPERPMHAGPFLYTPGAQEENKSFEFEYSIVAHSKNKNIVYSDNLSENACLQPISIVVSNNSENKKIEPIITNSNPFIRISSLRKKDGAILVTLYNLSEKKQETTIQVPATVSKVNQIMIDGTVVKELEKVENKLKVGFDPIEIKMLKLD
ncbi:MAG: hypothetical protein K9W45_01010 [Candidatus Heimdallarchaeum aukensis]|uniref:Glycoside hydrolase family 38 central domain-containing protein n=1 Tax=Candidatus Heimdallarchaeum aukensis TaxID=2876573 RepID=A0A9Y1FLP8_9ARCH|nr:MAG: hypothetical protein K9W45_01010 [Candidatus Heimdallarchaeum aukensis]